jgi:hypothetical protein
VRKSREFILFLHRGVSSRVRRLRRRVHLKKVTTDFNARARGEGLHLSFVLSFVENHRGSRLRFRRRVAHDDKSEKKKKEKTVVSQFVFVFLCQNRQTRKRPKKKIKILPLLNTPLYSSANDNTIHINIKTVWRAWMNSKSPKAEETKGTEI